MSKTRINYKSDFSLDVTFAINRTPVALPTNDFVVRFFVDGAPGVSYECSYIKGEYTNCEKKDENTLTCYIDNHKFGCGRLCCEFIDLEHNEKFTDSVQKTVTPSRLDIVLVEGAGDSSTNVSASVMVDIEAIISDLREALDDIEQMQVDIETLKDDKIGFYDASWISIQATRTVENFNALCEAIDSRSVIYEHNQQIRAEHVVVPSLQPYDKLVGVIFLDSENKQFQRYYLKLYNNQVRLLVGWVIDLKETYNKDEIDVLLAGKAGATYVENLGGRVRDIETWKTLVGTAESVVHYVDCDWLDAGSGTLQNYNTLRSGILADHKVLLKDSQTAIYYTADDVNNVLTVVFFNGTRIDTYTITKGSSSCSVSKTEKNVTTTSPFI